MSRVYTTVISENEYIGDSLVTINTNYANLDTSLLSVSTENIVLKARYNTLIQNLSGLGAPGTRNCCNFRAGHIIYSLFIRKIIKSNWDQNNLVNFQSCSIDTQSFY